MEKAVLKFFKAVNQKRMNKHHCGHLGYNVVFN